VADWNPHAPTVIGPEPLISESRQEVVDDPTVAYAQRFRSTATETITGLRLYAEQWGPFDEGRTMVAEVVDAGAETVDPAGLVSFTFWPSAVSGTAGILSVFPGGGTNYAAALGPGTGDRVSFGSGAGLGLRFGSGSFSAPGRIVDVSVIVTLAGDAPLVGGGNRTMRVDFSGSGVNQVGVPKVIPLGVGGAWPRAAWRAGEVCPTTGEPWTEADVQALSSTERVFVWAPTLTTTPVASVALVVTCETVERRHAYAPFSTDDLSNLIASWTDELPLVQPDGTAGWAKTSGADYSLVVRAPDLGDLNPASPPARMVWSGIAYPAGQDPPPGYTAVRVLSTTGAPVADGEATAAVPTVVQTERTLWGAVLATASGLSDDGQPYGRAIRVPVHSGAGASETELRTPTTDDYVGARLCVAWGVDDPFAPNPQPVPPTDDLVIEVRQRSDDALIGTLTLSPDDTVLGGVSTATSPVPFTLTAGTQYYVAFASATDPTRPWYVNVLAAHAGSTGLGSDLDALTYGGSTDVADPIDGTATGSWAFTPGDFSVVLDALIDTPGNFVAVADTVPIMDPGPCGVAGVPLVRLAWDASSLSGLFAHYRVQRLCPDGVTWETIGLVTDETATEFVDVEARLGVQECYRLRVETTLGTGSAWTADECVTLDPGGCVLTFSSNQAPEMSVAYADVYDRRPIREYAFPEAEEVQFRAMFGRDFQVGFRNLADRGVTFERNLLLNGLAAPNVPFGPAVADALRDLARAPLAYVAVRDSDGNRWYGTIRVHEARTQRRGSFVWARLTFVETTRTPAIADATGAP
jgi:hypothetical protein